MVLRKFWLSIALLASICLMANMAPAAVSSSANYSLAKDSLNGGGLAGASAGYDLESSLGQPEAVGSSTGTDYGLDPGLHGHYGDLSYILTVTLAGGGSGKVTSNPAGIDCGSSCVASYDPGTLVTLTATADADSSFTGWSGDGCTGTDPCLLTMNGNFDVTATFTGPPTITTQPQSQTTWTGQSATFSVTATGDGTLTYQWKKDGTDISGAVSSQYTIDPAALTHAGSYTCVVSNASGDVASDPAVLTVNETVSLTSQPQSQTVAAGASVTFSVAAQGTAPITYQWKKNGTDLTGQTNADLTFASAAVSDAGNYTCAATNGGGSVTSDPAVLTVIVGYTITASAGSGGTINPSGKVAVASGADQAFVITPDSTHSIAQIVVDGSPVTLPALAVGTPYTHTFTNVRQDHSIAASFTGPPVITTQPQSQTKWTGQSATFSVTATGDGTLTYQWKKGGADISGAVSSQYTIDPVTLDDAGTYSCVVSSAHGDTASDPATLTVEETVSLTSQPQSQTVYAGDSVTFAVTARGTEPITYQWKKDGNVLAGETNAALTIDPAATSHAGGYTCEVSNGGGSLTSDPAVLTVKQGYTITASAGPGGAIDPSGEVKIDEGVNKSFTITPDDHFFILRILVDGNPITLPAMAVGQAFAHTFENVAADHTIAAAFSPETVTLTVAVTGDGSGDTDPAAGEHQYDYGTVATIEAFPETGSVFGGWSGDVTGSENPIAVTMNGLKTVIAGFYVDTAETPRATLVNLPPQMTNAAQYTIDVGGIGVRAYKWKLDNGTYGAEAPVTQPISLKVKNEGRHTLNVVGVGANGKWQPEDEPTAYSWTVDLTPPTAVLRNYPRGAIGNNAIKVTVGGKNVKSYKYSLDQGTGDGANGFSNFYPVSTKIETSGLAPGVHSLEVIGEDLAGNWQAESRATRVEWTVNPDIPTAVFSGLPETITNENFIDAKVDGAAGGVEIDAYKYSLDEGDWVSASAGDNIVVTDLSEGAHTLMANAHGINDLWQGGGSGAGKGSATTHEWTVDLTGPAAPALAATGGDPLSTAAFLSWKSVEDNQKRYVLQYSFPREKSSKNVIIDLFLTPGPEGSEENFRLTGLTPGTEYQFSLKSVDAAGNESDWSSPPRALTTTDDAPRIESFALTGSQEASGINDQARELKITGQNFSGGVANSLVRFLNIKTSFDLSSKGGTETGIFVDIPLGAPVGVYHLKVIDKKGASPLSSQTYEVLIASPPLPEAASISPAIAGNDRDIPVVVKGSHLTGALSVELVPAKESVIVPLTGLTVVDDETIQAVVPSGLAEDRYQIRIETPNGRNQVSAAHYEAYTPQDLAGAQNPLNIIKPVKMPNDGVVPIKLTLSTDTRSETPRSNSTGLEIEARFDPGSAVTDAGGAPYNGIIDPPRQIPVEGLSESLDESAVAFTMGADQRLNLAGGRTITVVMEISLPGSKTDPKVYYLEADGSLTLAGVEGEKDGLQYKAGGTVLNTRFNTPETGYTTFAMGVLLDHMSTLAVASQSLPGPAITYLSPDRGSIQGGDEVTVAGANFLEGGNLEIDGADTTFTLVDSRTITFITPAHDEGAVDVTVINPDDQTATLAGGFTFQKDSNPAPAGGGCGGGGCFLRALP